MAHSNAHITEGEALVNSNKGHFLKSRGVSKIESELRLSSEKSPSHQYAFISTSPSYFYFNISSLETNNCCLSI